MALVNHAKKEINAKIVYYGAPGCGKRTALTYIYSRIKPSLRGELKNVPAGSDNLLLFDFSPFEAPLPNGYRFRLHVYTLTGTVTNPATWKMTLKGADGIMVMVNPAAGHEAVNRESVALLRDFLSAYGVNLHETPAVLQLNRFANDDTHLDAQQLAETLDLAALTPCCSNAAHGEGLLEALTVLSRQILDRVNPGEAREPHDNLAEERIEPDPSPDSAPAAVTTVSESPASAETEVTALPPVGDKPRITILNGELRSEGTSITIPLEIKNGEATKRFVVTVSIAAE